MLFRSNSINRNTGMSPFKIATSYNSRTPIELIPLSIDYRSSQHAEAFVQHIKNLQNKIRRAIILKTKVYINKANKHRYEENFKEKDMVMVRVRSE